MWWIKIKSSKVPYVLSDEFKEYKRKAIEKMDAEIKEKDSLNPLLNGEYIPIKQEDGSYLYSKQTKE